MSTQAELAYATLMIGKETITHSAKSEATDYFLEKLLSYLFQVKLKTSEGLAKGKARKRQTA